MGLFVIPQLVFIIKWLNNNWITYWATVSMSNECPNTLLSSNRFISNIWISITGTTLLPLNYHLAGGTPFIARCATAYPSPSNRFAPVFLASVPTAVMNKKSTGNNSNYYSTPILWISHKTPVINGLLQPSLFHASPQLLIHGTVHLDINSFLLDHFTHYPQYPLLLHIQYT